jgi:hypothetical protein
MLAWLQESDDMRVGIRKRDCPECGESFQFDSLVVRIGSTLKHKACFNKITPHERRYFVDSIGYFGQSPRVSFVG